MKKLLCIVFTACVLCGCGSESKPAMKTMTCTKVDGEADGTHSTITVDFDYRGNDIYKQKQTTEFKVSDANLYKDFRKAAKKSSLKDKVKGMKGIAYELDFQDDQGVVTESISFDLSKVSGKNYGELTGQTINRHEKLKLGVKETKASMEKAGLTCKK